MLTPPCCCCSFSFSAARRCFAWLDSRSSRVRRTLKKSTSTWLCSYSPEAVLMMYGPNRSPSRNLCGPVLQNTHIQLVSVVSASYLVLSVLTCRPRILLRSELFRLLPNFFVLCCVFSPSSSLIGVLMTVWLPLDLTCTYGPRYLPPPPASVLDRLQTEHRRPFRFQERGGRAGPLQCIPDAAGNPSSPMPFSVPALSAKNLDAIAVVADTMAAILSIVSQSFIAAAAAVPLSLPSSAATATGGTVLFALILLWMRDSSSFCWSGDASASEPAFRKSSCGKSFACG
uniref:Transmembrane protein n=1 Tax=Anopheles melas TaxID=34690 RepID=A0A182TJ46_9DIPT